MKNYSKSVSKTSLNFQVSASSLGYHSGSIGHSQSGILGHGYSGASLHGSGAVEHGNSGYLDYSSGEGHHSATIVKPVVKHGEPVVTKSFFIHQAPEEPKGSVHVVEKEHVVHPRKHYNIVFVKAPGGGSSSINNNNVNVYPQTEEKTIVYVLTGKSGQVSVNNNGDVHIPQPKAPSKPEVVFVKYNNEADAQRAISDIQSEFLKIFIEFSSNIRFFSDQYNNQKDASVSIVGNSYGNKGGTPTHTEVIQKAQGI